MIIDAAAGNVFDYTVTTPVGTGTISSSGITVTGLGTAFTSELAVGMKIIANGEERTIETVTSDTTLTVKREPDTAWSADVFAYKNPTITIKSSTFTGGAKATIGTVVVKGGALLNGCIFDCDVDYQNSNGTTITDVTCLEKFRIDATGTTVLNGTKIDTIRSTNGASTIVELDVNSSITNNPDGVTILTGVLPLTVTGYTTGARVYIVNETTDSDLYNDKVAGTSSTSFGQDSSTGP